MNNYTFCCIVDECKKDICTQQPKLWSSLRVHWASRHPNLEYGVLDTMVLPVTWWKVNADGKQYVQEYELARIINRTSFQHYN